MNVANVPFFSSKTVPLAQRQREVKEMMDRSSVVNARDSKPVHGEVGKSGQHVEEEEGFT